MDAGRLNKRVTFERNVTAPDEGGGSTSAWTGVATVWGGFQPERGRERLEAGRLEAAVAGTLTVRSSSMTRAIDASCRVVIDGDRYAIRSIVDPTQKREWLEMVVEKGVAS